MLQRSKNPKRPEWHYGSDDAVASKQGVLCHGPLPLDSIVIQSPDGEPALAVRHGRNLLAAEREAGADEAVDGVPDQPGAVRADVRCAGVE